MRRSLPELSATTADNRVIWLEWCPSADRGGLSYSKGTGKHQAKGKMNTKGGKQTTSFYVELPQDGEDLESGGELQHFDFVVNLPAPEEAVAEFASLVPSLISPTCSMETDREQDEGRPAMHCEVNRVSARVAACPPQPPDLSEGPRAVPSPRSASPPVAPPSSAPWFSRLEQ